MSVDLMENEKIVYSFPSGAMVTERPDGTDSDMSVFSVYDEDGGYIGGMVDLALSEDDRANFEDTSIYYDCIDIISSLEDGWADYYPTDLQYGKTDYDWKDPKKETEEVESLCKSDTIVFHLRDSSTEMLYPIYEGRGWDVYTGSVYGDGLSWGSVNELITRHDKILFMGHGTPRGLIGGNLTEYNSHLLKDKKVFALWCYAATFLKSQGLHGIFCSDNCPSDEVECKYVCDADVDPRWIYDNMVYLSECIRDVIDICWDNPEEACRLAREKYSQAVATTEDEKKVVEFNTNTLQVS